MPFRRTVKWQTGTPYQPLAKDHIRLLQVQQTPEHQISCHFKTVALSKTPPYIALSYVWGSSSQRRQVLLEGESMSVTDNLYDALLALLRHHMPGSWSSRMSNDLARVTGLSEHVPQYFWVDALCINQASIYERNQQVALMRDIYAGAHRVYVWLGTGLDALARAITDIRGGKRSMEKVTREDSVILGDALRRPYWKRMWVIQELMLAKRPMLLTASDLVEWAYLQTYYKALKDIEVWQSSAPIPGDMYFLSDDSNQRGPNYHDTLPSLIHRWAEQDCTDRRDGVFALLGICHGLRKREVTQYLHDRAHDPTSSTGMTSIEALVTEAAYSADYTRTLDDIYQDVMEAVRESYSFETKHNLELFSRRLRKALRLSDVRMTDALRKH